MWGWGGRGAGAGGAISAHWTRNLDMHAYSQLESDLLLDIIREQKLDVNRFDVIEFEDQTKGALSASQQVISFGSTFSANAGKLRSS